MNIKPVILLVLVGALVSSNSASFLFSKAKPLSPVILIPGFGGSRIQSRLNKSQAPHLFCRKTTSWYDLWLNIELLIPLIIDCWIDNVKLVYDVNTRTTHNPVGVETRIPGWGDPDSVEMLDRGLGKSIFGQYFKEIGEALVGLGYKKNVSLRGAPYDFRKAPNELGKFYDDLKQLIEETYNLNSQTPVSIICHSMGCPMSLYFLNKQSQQWKDTYLMRYITLAAPWGGLAKSVKVFAVGDDIGVPVLSGKTLRRAQITMPSLAYLMPSNHFWTEEEVLVRTFTKDYTVNDIEDFFQNLNYTTGLEMWKDTKDFLALEPPNVETHCLIGTDLQTFEQLNYNGDDFNSKPKIVYGDGDGTVNLKSLKGCEKWVPLQEKEVHLFAFPHAEHYEGILRRADVIDYLLNVLLK